MQPLVEEDHNVMFCKGGSQCNLAYEKISIVILPSKGGVPTEHGCACDCASKTCEVTREADRGKWADRIGVRE